MKKIISVLLVLVLVLSFTGCGDKEAKKPAVTDDTVDKGRVLYNRDLTAYVELGEYKGLTVDTNSKEFKEQEQEVINYDVESNMLYKGTVKKGDTVNIDYVGEKDGVAFDGGSAQGYNLKIGSGTFIPGFEEGLIGAKVGTIVSLNLTFPKEYHSSELAGQEVTFTVRINYTDKKTAQEPKEYYKKLGFDTVEKYYENVRERAIEETLVDVVIKNSKVKKYPDKDIETIYKFYYDTIKASAESYQMTMEQYFEAIGQTEAKFKEQVVKEEIKPLMDQQMLWYAILDAEKIGFTKNDTEAKIKQIIAETEDASLTRADVIAQFGEIYLENVIVSEKVFKFLKDNAKIS